MKSRLPTLTSIMIAILILAACSPAPIADNDTSGPSTLIPPTNTKSPPTEIPPTETPSIEAVSTQTAIPQLSARSTFEVISAVHGHILFIEEWQVADVSLYERQAVLYPQLEFMFSMLEKVFKYYRPHPDLANRWDLAERVFTELMPVSLGWASGEIPTENFQPKFSELNFRITETTENATSTAEELGVDTSQYGTDFTRAIQAANALLAELAIGPLPELPGRGDLNPEMIPIQITPFIFDFAGSEVFFTIGVIENISDIPQQNATIEVTYFNFLDENLGTVRGRLLADVANPGGSYPFIATDVIYGEEAALKDQTRYEMVVFSSPAEAESYQAFELSVSSSQEYNGELLLLGQLTNTGDTTLGLERIHIGAAAYDQVDILIGVGEGRPTDEGDLAPGSATTFEIIIQTLAGEPTSYQLFAEAVNFP
jgi:hypothetical protein